jgi:hypothetical protein
LTASLPVIPLFSKGAARDEGGTVHPLIISLFYADYSPLKAVIRPVCPRKKGRRIRQNRGGKPGRRKKSNRVLTNVRFPVKFSYADRKFESLL